MAPPGACGGLAGGTLGARWGWPGACWGLAARGLAWLAGGMLGGWSERMEGRLLWLLRLGHGLAEGRSERMRGCASCGHGGRRPGWGRAWGRRRG